MLIDEKNALQLALVIAAKAKVQKKGHVKDIWVIRDQLERLKNALKAEQAKAPPTLITECKQLIEAAYSFLNGSTTSPTLAILNEKFFSPEFSDLGPSAQGVHRRFMKPTVPLGQPSDAKAKPTRKIDDKQAGAYKIMRDQIIMKELEYSKDYYVFYHAQDPRMRVAQDIFAHAYAKYYKAPVPEDFYFFRFPKPGDETFSRWKDANQFLIDKILETGMIDDNDGGTKLYIISANLSLFGSLGHAGEETFHYFQIGKGQTELNPTNFVATFLEGFGYISSSAGMLVSFGNFIDTSEGSLFQIFVPKKKVDEVAWMAHPHGIPFDDDLLNDIHAIGNIRYQWEDLPEGGRALKREKMNDELTRKLKLFPQRKKLDGIAAEPKQLHSILKKGTDKRKPLALSAEELQKREDDTSRKYRKELDELTSRTVERARKGAYFPSKFLDQYAQDPSVFRDKRFEHLKKRKEEAPDHIGHGIQSEHEVLRVRNRPLFMQARILLSSNLMLNPNSGIKIFRHTTVHPNAMQNYKKLLDFACRHLITA